MMAAHGPDPDADRAPDQLPPRLREAVEAVLRDPLPEELSRRSLEGLRRVRPKIGRASRRRSRFLAALAVAATVLGAAVLWQLLGGDGDGVKTADPRKVEERAPAPEPAPVPDEPWRRQQELPTLWAYHQAAREGPEQFDALLDRHADRLSALDFEPVSFGTSLGFEDEETL